VTARPGQPQRMVGASAEARFRRLPARRVLRPDRVRARLGGSAQRAFRTSPLLLQIGYFKAKRAFFVLSEQNVPAEDISFVLERYLPGSPVALRPLRQSEQYAQRTEIAGCFGYRLWSESDRQALVETATLLAKRDVTPSFILIEILGSLKTRKIVRPGYTTLQTVISDALAQERRRLAQLVEDGLAVDTQAALQALLVREETLSELAALKQDANISAIR
jgi:hypothetical protein